MLDYLFHKSKFKDYFIFKGGTSLSKCYNIIDRFSEDIDLILKWNFLTDDNMYNDRSKTKQDQYNKNMNELASKFIKDKLLPDLINDFELILGYKPIFEIEEINPQVISFIYPRVSEKNESNILKNIRLEIGPLAALVPTEKVNISPLISKLNSPLMKKTNTVVETVSPERTFWEKVLILHQEAHRPEIKKVPDRYSRHFYDVYKISKTIYKEKAFKDLKLLELVREFKIKFYPSSWSSYQTAKPGLFDLIPKGEHYNQLKMDFISMKDMINDKSLCTFEDLMKEIKTLEIEMNNL